jgi:mono/diheme cytochrome c family protein
MKQVFILLSLLIASPIWAADGKAILDKHCISCHNINGPAAQSVEELWARLGPDLFLAGSKYKAEWLEAWLIKPVRIRPAGHHAVQNIHPGKERDVIDTDKLKPHLALSSNEAKVVTELLMSFKAPSDLVKKGAFKGGKISVSFGEMVFDKFNGCAACHQIEPGFGGLSGPEVYTAAQRLQEDYLVSFISDPQAFNPKTAMPNKHTSKPNIQKLVQYLIALSKEDWDEAQ